MPNTYVNKVTANGQTLIDLTADTALAADVAQGKYFHLATGERVAGTASGGGGDSYTLTTVVPQQTFTPQESANNSYQAVLTYTAGLEDGETYLVTFDGEQYACECGVLWGSDYMAGAIGTFWGERSDNPYPFGIDYAPSTPEFAVATYDLNQHTIKVEHLEFVDGPLTIITKTITENGTYNASSDGADGYSSVMVNVPTSGSSMNVQVAQNDMRTTSTSYMEVINLTCDTAGTYDVYWTTFRSSSQGTWGSQLYLGNTAYGTADTGNWSNHVQNVHLTGVNISANQKVSVYVRSRGSGYFCYVGTLIIVQTA